MAGSFLLCACRCSILGLPFLNWPSSQPDLWCLGKWQPNLTYQHEGLLCSPRSHGMALKEETAFSFGLLWDAVWAFCKLQLDPDSVFYKHWWEKADWLCLLMSIFTLGSLQKRWTSCFVLKHVGCLCVSARQTNVCLVKVFFCWIRDFALGFWVFASFVPESVRTLSTLLRQNFF